MKKSSKTPVLSIKKLLAVTIMFILIAGCSSFESEPIIVGAAGTSARMVVNESGENIRVQQPAVTEEPTAEEMQSPASETIAAAPAAEAVIGTFSGQVRNLSTDEAVGEGILVLLYVINDRFQEEILRATTDQSGHYLFDNVPVQRGWHYLISAQYGTGYFTGGMVAGSPSEPDVDLPVAVYDVTDDPSVMHIDSVLTQIVPIENSLRVVQIFQFKNESNLLYVTEEVIDNAHNASVTVPLPAGAQVQSFNNQDRYILSADGQTVISLAPIFPQETHIVHIIYTLPFSNPSSIQQQLDYRLNGSVEVIAPEVLGISSSQLTTGSAEVVDGHRYLTYAGTVALAAGDSLQYEVRGAFASETPASGNISSLTVAVALFAFGAVLITLAVWSFWQKQRMPQAVAAADTIGSASNPMDDLVRQIADLDRLYQTGQVEEEAYRAKRDQLKARLAQLMKQQ